MAPINLKTLDLNLLVVFEAVYSAGNITHAAEQLAMSQPAVSHALSRLRDLLGDRLFVRAKRGVEPTLKAKQIIEPVRDALHLIRQQLDSGDDIDLSSYRRTFRIVMVDALEPIIMPPILRLIGDRAPGIAIESFPAFRLEVDSAIRAGTIDLACYAYPFNAPEIVTKPIGAVDLVVVARRGHPRIGKTLDVRTWQSLAKVGFVPELRPLVNIEKDLAAHQVPHRVVYSVTKLWSIPAIVKRTDLVSMLPRRFAEEVARNFAISIHEPPVDISEQYMYMCWHTKNEADPGHRWLREAVLSALRQATSEPGAIPRLRRRSRRRGEARPPRSRS